MDKLKEKIKQLSREHFEYELPELLCSEEKLELEVETGKIYKGTLVIRNKENRRMKGLLYSSSHLLCLDTDSFVGTEATVSYEVHAEDIRVKDTIQGVISIVSSCGEKEIPYTITVVEKYIEASFGEVKDLFHFTNLAKINWTKAVGIFKTEDFEKLLLKKDTEKQNLYQELIKSSDTNQALEEFLVAIQKKESTRISVEKQHFSYQVRKEDISGALQIKKDNWGYLDFEVYVNQDFLEVENSRINNEVFIGNSYQLPFEIKNANLRAGKNFAKIILKNMYQKIEINFEIEKIVKHMERDYDAAKRKRYEIILINNYINFRSNRIAISDYVLEMRDAVHKLAAIEVVLRNLGELGYSRRLDLYRIHLYMVEGNDEKAREILAALDKEEHILKKNTLVDYCGYLYLKALFSRKDSDLQYALREIRECYKQQPESWSMLWFLLFLDEKYDREPKEKIEAIERQFERGCKSPVLYYEICNLLHHDPTLLSELTPCMVQAINMGVKQEMISAATAAQYAALSEKEKGYHRIILSNLVTLYEKYGDTTLLAAICSMLIKSGISDNSCFGWYEAGVKEQLRINQLYEYYMYAIDEEYAGLLPKDIYLYFSYNTNLLEEKKEFLYSNIVQHKHEIPDVYQMYLEQMKQFVFNKLQKHRIDKELAVLYREFVTEAEFNSTIAKDVPNILFKQMIECKHPAIVGVCVAHKECKQEVYTPFDKKGRAYVDIFTDKATIVLVDNIGRRYESSIPWSKKKLMKRNRLAEICYEYNLDDQMLSMYIYERIEYYHKRNVQIKDLQKQIENDWLKDEYKKKWIMKLIQSYYDNYEGEALEQLLMEIDLHGMSKSDRNLVTEYCIIRGLYDLAYEQIQEYSFEGVTVKRLRALCSKTIKKKGMETEDAMLAKMAFFVFKAGKYDEAILKYLVSHYLGTTKDMFLIWREAKEYDIETIDLEERLLGQILFAESYVQDAMSVFMAFYEKGRNRTLIKAFVSYYAYKYLVRDRVVNHEFFDIIRKELQIEENRTALFALLKYYSTLETWNEEERVFIKTEVSKLIEEGMIFPFFQIFAKKMDLPGNLENQYFIEYKTDPKHKVVLHYFVEDEEMGDGFEEEEMSSMYKGVFVKSFTLFQNETLQYYLEEFTEQGDSIIAESITVKGDELFSDENEDEFSQINTMLIAREMKDEKTLLTLLGQYEKTEYAMRHVFKMIQ